MKLWQKLVYRLINYRARKILREFIVTICAEDNEILKHIRLQKIALRVEHYVTKIPFFYFLLFKFSLYVFEFALPPLSFKLKPFTKMTLNQRMEYFEEWQASRIYIKRMLFKMIQCICVAHVYSERKLLAELGYEESLRHRMQ